MNRFKRYLLKFPHLQPVKNVLSESSTGPLLDYFERSFPLNEAEKQLASAKFHSRLFRKRQFLLQEGDICTQLNFVVRGCLRTYKIDEKGATHILQFATENYWINDLGSFSRHYAFPA